MREGGREGGSACVRACVRELLVSESVGVNPDHHVGYVSRRIAQKGNEMEMEALP